MKRTYLIFLIFLSPVIALAQNPVVITNKTLVGLWQYSTPQVGANLGETF